MLLLDSGSWHLRRSNDSGEYDSVLISVALQLQCFLSVGAEPADENTIRIMERCREANHRHRVKISRGKNKRDNYRQK
jgi:hypothetical protein